MISFIVSIFTLLLITKTSFNFLKNNSGFFNGSAISEGWDKVKNAVGHAAISKTAGGLKGAYTGMKNAGSEIVEDIRQRAFQNRQLKRNMSGNDRTDLPFNTDGSGSPTGPAGLPPSNSPSGAPEESTEVAVVTDNAVSADFAKNPQSNASASRSLKARKYGRQAARYASKLAFAGAKGYAVGSVKGLAGSVGNQLSGRPQSMQSLTRDLAKQLGAEAKSLADSDVVQNSLDNAKQMGRQLSTRVAGAAMGKMSEDAGHHASFAVDVQKSTTDRIKVLNDQERQLRQREEALTPQVQATVRVHETKRQELRMEQSKLDAMKVTPNVSQSAIQAQQSKVEIIAREEKQANANRQTHEYQLGQVQRTLTDIADTKVALRTQTQAATKQLMNNARQEAMNTIKKKVNHTFRVQ